MYVKSVIIEKIEYDGKIKAVQLDSSSNGQVIIAFPHEYTDKRRGPFYFQNRQHDKAMGKLNKASGSRKLNSKHFHINGFDFYINLPWRNIPTEQGALSYYALTLPNYAVPIQVEVTNPHSGGQLKKAVVKDTQKNCYVIYIECRSKHRVFNFDLICSFRKATQSEFYSYEYHDENLISDVYAHYDAWQSLTSNDELDHINIFMEANNMEFYQVNQAAAVGRNAKADNTQMTQVNQSKQQEADPAQMLETLSKFREELVRQALGPEQILEIAKVAEAEIAVKNGDVSAAKKILSTLGKWTYDIAVKLGVALVVEQLK
ncbi:hypothetical protein D3C75_738250 [compost metagenome]